MQGVHSSCHFDTVLSSLLQLSLLVTSSFTFRVRRASMGQQTMQIETTVIVHAGSYIGHANMWLSSTGRPEEIVTAQHQVQVRARVQVPKQTSTHGTSLARIACSHPPAQSALGSSN